MVALWQPLAAYLTLKFDAFVLRRYKRKPVQSIDSQKIRTFTTSFYIMSLFIAMTNYYTFMTSPTCPIGYSEAVASDTICNANTTFAGAFEGKASPFAAVLPDAGSTFFSVTNVIMSPLFSYSVIIIFMTQYVLERKHRGSITAFTDQKVLDMQEQVQMISTQLKKKETRIEYLEKAKKRAAAS